MQVGIKLRNATRLPVQETRNHILELAQAADGLGFYSAWVIDHVLMLPSKYSSPSPSGVRGIFAHEPDNAYWEPLTVLASVAAITQRIRLGTSVLVLPLRHPIYAAKVLATLDCLSDGRLILGAGLGWLRKEMDLLGAPTSRQRGALADEHIRIYKELWTKDEPQFEGRWFRFSGFQFSPKPVQKPHIPIWIGGSSDAALRRVARLGDGWHSHGQTVDRVAACVQRLKQLCQEQGRSLQDLTLSSSLGGGDIILDMDAKGNGDAEILGLDKIGAPIFRGNPDQIAHTIRRYSEAGLTHICGSYSVKGGAPGLGNSLQAAKIVAKEIIPQVG